VCNEPEFYASPFQRVGAGIGHLYDQYTASQEAAREAQRKALEEEKLRKALEEEKAKKKKAEKYAQKQKEDREANQKKQLLGVQQQKQAEKLKKEQSQHAKTGAVAKKREERAKVHEKQLEREKIN
jgi:hypothetical protein